MEGGDAREGGPADSSVGEHRNKRKLSFQSGWVGSSPTMLVRNRGIFGALEESGFPHCPVTADISRVQIPYAPLVLHLSVSTGELCATLMGALDQQTFVTFCKAVAGCQGLVA